METALVSIIIPIYNISEYLDKCVQSACNQTYRNLEIILVDDGSPDDCPAKCDAWAVKDSRIRVIHKPNGGLSDARNAGLDAATGEYIYFLDGDDYIEANLVEKALSYMTDDVDMVYFGYYLECPGEKTIKDYFRSGTVDLCTDEQRRRFIISILIDGGWAAWKRLLRKSVIDRFEIRFEDNKKIFAEDMYFFLCYSAHARKCVGINNCLYHYIVRSDSIMGTNSIKLNVGRINELSKAVKKHYQKFDDCKDLWNIFPIIHYFIIDTQLKLALQKGIHICKLRKIVYQDVQDVEYFREQLHGAYAQRLMFYKWLDWWRATDRVNTCRYLLNGSYNELRIRNRLLYYFPQCYIQKSSAIQKIDDECRAFVQNKKRIYLIGTEDYANLGDQQIAEAIVAFLNTHFPECSLKEIPFSKYKVYKPCLQKYISKNDLIIFPGGGNVGDVYLGAHDIRIDAIQNWPQNPKLIFPQSVFFENDGENAAVLAQCRAAFTRENNVTLFAREEKSYMLAKKYFSCESILVPDIVLSMNEQAEVPRKKQVLFCFRSDEEKSVSDAMTDKLHEIVCAAGISVTNTDLQLDYHVDKVYRKAELLRAISLWRESQVLITDRLHGMIFAAITGTPCIAFSNYNHKIKGTYEWIKYLPYIRYAESVTDVEKYLPELLEIENCQYDNAPLMPYFEKLARVVEKYICD